MRVLRSSGRVVPPLAARRSPTEDIWSKLYEIEIVEKMGYAAQ